MILDLSVYGIPVPQGRPRARAYRVGAATRVQVYDPATSRDWKRTVLAQVLEHKPPTPVEGPLSMTLHFFLPRPRSLPKRVEFPTTRPDLDNFAKAVLDALRGVIYRDDAQIVHLSVSKHYNDVPGVSIRLWRMA